MISNPSGKSFLNLSISTSQASFLHSTASPIFFVGNKEKVVNTRRRIILHVEFQNFQYNVHVVCENCFFTVLGHEQSTDTFMYFNTYFELTNTSSKFECSFSNEFFVIEDDVLRKNFGSRPDDLKIKYEIHFPALSSEIIIS